MGNFGWVIADVFHRAYEPMIGALERHPAIRVGLHYSGPLLEWLTAEQPGFVDRVRRLVDREQVEMLGGGLYEPVLPSLPERDRLGQLTGLAEVVERIFGRRPSGAWLAERVWEPSLPRDLARAGYRWTVLDDNHLRAASVREDEMWGTYITDDQGEPITLFGSEQGLRYLIPFCEVSEVIDHLRRHATPDGRRLGMMGDDGEKFGAWPDTYEHCWGAGGWVDRCFAALEQNADWLTTVTPSGWLDLHPPIDRIYVPAGSYLEMTQWALPPDEANVFERLVHRAHEERLPEERFLRGGFWRNFARRYREINLLHRQMLRVSEKVERMPPRPDRDRARDHLYRGQSNDCYWHGLFGGLYIVHMRLATLEHLIAAEALADQPGAPTSLGDFDLDGREEVLVATAGQVLLVDPADGGGIASWDLRATRLALGSVLRRRPEAYHETLRAHAAGAANAADLAAEAGAVRSIHDVVRVKEPGLEERLIYDDHERMNGLLHVVALPEDGPPSDPQASADAWRRGERDGRGDFLTDPWELVSWNGGSVVLRRLGQVGPDGNRHPLEVYRELRFGGGLLDPVLELDLRLVNPSEERLGFEAAVEWNVNLAGGGANPAAFYEWSEVTGPLRAPHDGSGEVAGDGRITFGNEQIGVRIQLTTSPAATLTWYPVETISNSEAGFERAYQGSCLLARWPVRLEPGTERRLSVRLEVSQSMDRTEEERR